MPKRKIVKLNLPVVNPLIKKEFRSNIVFCENMGRAHNWVTDWNRKNAKGDPTPKNLPSPEEAAKMCTLLCTTPEEILLGVGDTPEDTQKLQDDIALVKSLVEQENAKKAPDPQIEGDARKIIDFIHSASEEEMSEIENFVAYLESKRKKE